MRDASIFSVSFASSGCNVRGRWFWKAVGGVLFGLRSSSILPSAHMSGQCPECTQRSPRLHRSCVRMCSSDVSCNASLRSVLVIPSHPGALGEPRSASWISLGWIEERRVFHVEGVVFFALCAYSSRNHCGGLDGGWVGDCKSLLACSMR